MARARGCDRVARHAGGPAATRGGDERRDGNRRGARQARQGHAALSRRGLGGWFGRRGPAPHDRADGLLRDPVFRLWWVGRTITVAGSALTQAVLPILVFQLTGSAVQTSLLLVLESAPYLAFGLLAGAVADRVNRRALMIGCDLVAAALLASIPVAHALGTLTVAQVYAVAGGTALVFVWSDAADFGALSAIVGRARITQAVSALWGARTMVMVAAPAAGGLLVATIGAAPTLSLDAASYLVSALVLARIPRAFSSSGSDRAAPAADQAVPGGGSGRRRLPARLAAEIGEGVSFIRHHPVIRPLILLGIGTSLTGGAVMGLLVVFGVRQLGLADDDPRLGLLYAAGVTGSVAATLALPRLTRRLGAPRVTLFALPVMLAGLVGLAMTTAVPPALALLCCWQGAYSLIITNGIAVRQEVTPDALQSRVNATGRMVAWGGYPIGAALGGMIADAAGVRVAWLVLAAGVATSTVAGWASGLRRLGANDPVDGREAA